MLMRCVSFAGELTRLELCACLICALVVAGCRERTGAALPQQSQVAAKTASTAPPPPPPADAPYCVKDDPGQWLQGTSQFVVIGAHAASEAWRGLVTLTRSGSRFNVIRVVADRTLEGEAESQRCGGGEYQQFVVHYDDGSVAICHMTGNGRNEMRFVCDVSVKGQKPGMETWYEPPLVETVNRASAR
jgi:hypothetical protein